MISAAPSLDDLIGFDADVCVIGAGPVGIVTALELSARGMRVLLLESGADAASPAAQALSAHENLRPDNHHDPEIAVARRLGGTSNLWGGRCLPFDPVDFSRRDWPELPVWPIGPADLAPFEDAACRYLAAGAPVWREALSEVSADAAFAWETLERWSNTPRIQNLHRATLAGNAGFARRDGRHGDRVRLRRRRACLRARFASRYAGSAPASGAASAAVRGRQRKHATPSCRSSAADRNCSAGPRARSGVSIWDT